MFTLPHINSFEKKKTLKNVNTSESENRFSGFPILELK